MRVCHSREIEDPALDGAEIQILKKWIPHQVRNDNASNPKDLGMVAPLLELCHPQAAPEAATQD